MVSDRLRDGNGPNGMSDRVIVAQTRIYVFKRRW